ncbi:MAG: SDR family NAD(P)-dependent oxidoreductase [Streptococcaceae bacterium]|jgi:NAD(P)-dependent dehydrogenase (short-subunit alcohol dehydrogenase family)|nr:SDR family NAD(P)-dependent oxidoreductase [Streptococcaceae bacterium]
MKSQEKVVLITGASKGMGYEATKLFASKGWQVVAGARRVAEIPSGKTITALKLDVTNHESNQAFVSATLEKFGRVDVLLNNAGYGAFGPIEEIPLEEARRQFEVNFFGACDLTQLVLPTMRAQKFGRIVNISSTGGDGHTPLGSYYHATKAALQQWSDVLDSEVAQFGIRSTIVQPGGTKSDWGDVAVQHITDNLKENSPYAPLAAQISQLLTAGATQATATSADLAKVFYRAATDITPKRRYFNAFRDRFMVYMSRSHPNLTNRLSAKYFASITKRAK